MATKLSIRNLYKIFGEAPEEARKLLDQGKSKDEILTETGNTVGVQDVSFDIEQGSIFVVMGLSGSGKSTLIRMLNGLIPPTSGNIMIDGDDVASADKESLRAIRRSKISMVFQHFALFPHKTVLDNVAFGLKVKGVGRKERNERAEKALKQVGLGAYAKSYPEQLSGGMQQRVGLARGLAAEPEVLLMDEPFGALDPLIRRDMQDELLQLQKTLHKTIVFITHDLNEALILGDRIAIMKGGRFVQVGTAEDIVGNPADDYVSAFTRDIDRSRVFKADRVARPAHALEIGEASPQSAIAAMEQHERNALYIVEGGKPVGLVRYRDLAEDGSGGRNIESALMRDFPQATGRTPINDLYILADRGLPIAIVDEDGRLTGVVDSSAIFAELGRGEEANKPSEMHVAQPAAPQAAE